MILTAKRDEIAKYKEIITYIMTNPNCQLGRVLINSSQILASEPNDLVGHIVI